LGSDEPFFQNDPCKDDRYRRVHRCEHGDEREQTEARREEIEDVRTDIEDARPRYRSDRSGRWTK
jgi:hypothetical protein